MLQPIGISLATTGVGTFDTEYMGYDDMMDARWQLYQARAWM